MTAAIAGVVPREVITPKTGDELATTVRRMCDERRPFAFVGGATELELGNAPRVLDVAIRTTALDRVLEYNPGDQTITVEAGLTFAELDRVLAEHGQVFPFDVADRGRATIGGALATNANGRRRHRFGALKDAIVGVELVRADGTRARGGGKVVKNVAGFDLPKLVVGSLGTLGAIVRATFRVFPRPPVVRTLRVRGDGDELVAAIHAARLEPVSVAGYEAPGIPRALVVTFAGTANGVAAQVEAFAAAARRARADLDELDDETVARLEDLERHVRLRGAWRIRHTAPPKVLALDLARTERALPGPATTVIYPTLGIVWRSCDADYRDADAAAEGIRALRGASSGPAVVHAMPAVARGRVDAWGEPPPSFPIMRALKERFDPLGLCNSGRFVGGL